METLRWNRICQADINALAQAERIFYPPGYAFPMHRHDFHELVIVCSGSGFHDTAGGATALVPGMVVAIRPELAHRCRAGAAPLTFLNLVLHPYLADELAPFIAEVPGWAAPGDPPALAFHGEDATTVLAHAADLEREPPDRLSLVACLAGLAWRCRRLRRADRPDPLCARILAALDDPQVLVGGAAAVARAVGCTREHLTRVARRGLGRPLAALIAERRLDSAARLLRQGALPVTEVCLASGHGNLGHFHAVFRRRFGCTPQQYRERAPGGAA